MSCVRWADTGGVVDHSRPCAACGLEFRPCDHEDCALGGWEEFHDPSIGHLAGDVVSACCGHGVEPGHLNVRTVVRLSPYPWWGSRTAAAPADETLGVTTRG